MQELRNPGAPEAVKNWASSTPGWLEVSAPRHNDLSLMLGAGEREAISLAREIDAELVLIDERAASRVAQSLGLTVAGTLAVLDLAAERKLIDVAVVLGTLRQTSFRATEALYDELLRRDAARQ